MEAPEDLPDGQEIRQDLGGMIGVAQRVPDRDTGPVGELADQLVLEAPEDDAVEEAPEHPGDVAHRFLLAEADVVGREDLEVGALVRRGHREGGAGPARGLEEDQGDVPVGEAARIDAATLGGLQVRGSVDQEADLLAREIPEREKASALEVDRHSGSSRGWRGREAKDVIGSPGRIANRRELRYKAAGVGTAGPRSGPTGPQPITRDRRGAMSQAEASVLQELREGVLLLTLNRPRKKNAFDDAQWDGLRDALLAAREDPEVAVVVVTGAGRDFSAGADLSAFGDRSASRDDGRPNGYYGCMEALVAFDKPLLAAARGVGVGIGATFLFHCDIVYVGESVRLRLPFVSLGLVPEAASSYLLPAMIGTRRANELFFTAEWIDAARALETGIATRVLPDEVLLEAALLKAREIARHPVTALQATKRTLKAVHDAAIRAALACEDEGMSRQAGSPENIEAVRAFLEKRPPDFRKLRSGS
jgi:enoyl-CoA hydratase/carnithine racemase